LVSPSGNLSGRSSFTVGDGSTISDTVGEPISTRFLGTGGFVHAFTVTSSIVIVGGVVSTTVTVRAFSGFPALSVDVHMLLVTPNGKNDPEGGSQTALPGPSIKSTLELSKVTPFAPPIVFPSTSMSSRGNKNGPTVSLQILQALTRFLKIIWILE